MKKYRISHYYDREIIDKEEEREWDKSWTKIQ